MPIVWKRLVTYPARPKSRIQEYAPMNGGETKGRMASVVRSGFPGMCTRARTKATGTATTRAARVTRLLTRKLWPMVRE